jgi:prevent-host-death family protein
MRELGERELKLSLSETLRSVSRGRRVRVTVRGRPVAEIVPVGVSAEQDCLRELAAQGRVLPPARALPKRPPPMVKSARSASSLVLSERETER